MADSFKSLEATYQELYRVDSLDRIISDNRRKESEIYDWSHEDWSPEDWEIKYDSSEIDASRRAEWEVKDALWVKASQQVDHQRTALRARAASLCRPSLHPRTILHLPTDLLVQIFSHLKHHMAPDDVRFWDWETSNSGPTPDPSSLTIHRARQVCRAFNELASPYLSRRLVVELSQESLDRAEELISNLHIARGIRGFMVIIQYRPAEAALDLELFARVGEDDLRLVKRHLPSYDREESEDQDQGAVERCESMVEAWKKHLGIEDECEAWEVYYSNEPEKEELPAEKDLEYQKILFNAHEEYARLHDEQLGDLISRQPARRDYVPSEVRILPLVTTLKPVYW
ncbi:hypothetical protein ACJ41O_001819 [Fusarium nematophilum]